MAQVFAADAQGGRAAGQVGGAGRFRQIALEGGHRAIRVAPPAGRSWFALLHHQQVPAVAACGLGQGDHPISLHGVAAEGGGGLVLLEENTVFEFSVQAANRIIDRTTTLLAKTEVSLKDNKEGFVAVRVTRALEHPSDKPELFTDANGIPSEVKVLNNDGVTGSYLSANGLTGEAVWGTRAPWVALNGVVEDQAVAITILDHPDNLGYPTYWHARGYGLFAANPLGQKVFSEGAEILNASLSSGESLTFKYRIVVSDQNMDATLIAPFEQF